MHGAGMTKLDRRAFLESAGRLGLLAAIGAPLLSACATDGENAGVQVLSQGERTDAEIAALLATEPVRVDPADLASVFAFLERSTAEGRPMVSTDLQATGSRERVDELRLRAAEVAQSLGTLQRGEALIDVRTGRFLRTVAVGVRSVQMEFAPNIPTVNGAVRAPFTETLTEVNCGLVAVNDAIGVRAGRGLVDWANDPLDVGPELLVLKYRDRDEIVPFVGVMTLEGDRAFFPPAAGDDILSLEVVEGFGSLDLWRGRLSVGALELLENTRQSPDLLPPTQVTSRSERVARDRGGLG